MEKITRHLTANERREWKVVSDIVTDVYSISHEYWCYGRCSTPSAEAYTMPRAIACYIAKHPYGLGWGTGRIRAATSGTLFMRNQNTVLTAVKVAKDLVGASGGRHKWPMMEVLRRYCEESGRDLEMLTKESTLTG